MDSQTEVCIFRLEIFLSFWRMRRWEIPPTTVSHPRRVQRCGQPSCTYHHSIFLTGPAADWPLTCVNLVQAATSPLHAVSNCQFVTQSLVSNTIGTLIALHNNLWNEHKEMLVKWSIMALSTKSYRLALKSNTPYVWPRQTMVAHYRCFLVKVMEAWLADKHWIFLLPLQYIFD